MCEKNDELPTQMLPNQNLQIVIIQCSCPPRYHDPSLLPAYSAMHPNVLPTMTSQLRLMLSSTPPEDSKLSRKAYLSASQRMW